MKYLLIAIYLFCIIGISGCHHEPQSTDEPVQSSASSPSNNDIKKRALVIGINNYSDQNNMPELKEKNLQHAVDDALAIKIRLENMGFQVDELSDKNGEKVTAKRISDQLDEYKNMDCNTQFILFYSGHGAADEQEGYIVSSDGERIPFEDIRNKTYGSNGLRSKHILYIFDSCHSGFFDPAVQAKWTSKKPSCGPSQGQERKSKPAVYTLTAGSSNEETTEAALRWYGHSFFTYYLLKGLDGVADIDDDCEITASELGVYLTQVIPSQVVAQDATSKQTGNNKPPQRQNPLFNRVFGEGEITFTPPRCKDNQKSSRQQQLFLDKICETCETQLQLLKDTDWERSNAYKGRPAYKEPTQLLVDSDKNLYVLDAPAKKVYKFDAEGKYIRSYYKENRVPTSIALNNDSSSLWVYYSSDEQGEVFIYEEGKEPRRWEVKDESEENKNGVAACVLPNDIPRQGLLAIDAENNIILADQKTGILSKCNIKGERFGEGKLWGKPEPDPKTGEKNYIETVTNPQGLAVDKFGYI